VLELSGSEYGFAGEVLRNPDGQPYMRIHAVPWTEETKGFYEAHAPRNMEFTNLDTLFGSVMRTGETVIANDPAHDPRSGGLLEGHPKLENFLGLSLNAGSSLRGIIGVANRPGGYDQALVDYLGPLLRSYEMLIDRIATRQQRRAAEASLQESDQQVRDLAIPAVENEHRELIDLINNCYEEMGSGEDPQTVVRLLDDIHTAISVHFRHEEELMENIGYPEYAAHKMQHERLLDTLRGHIDRFADDPDHALEVVQNILAEWFGQHFSTSDLQLQQHLQE